MLDFSPPEVGRPGSVMSFLNIVETWSGKGTLEANLQNSHLGRPVGENPCCWTWAVHHWFLMDPTPWCQVLGSVVGCEDSGDADSVLRVEGYKGVCFISLFN